MIKNGWLFLILIVGGVIAIYFLAYNIGKKAGIREALKGGGHGYSASAERGGIWNCVDKDGNPYKSTSPCPKRASLTE